MRLVPAIAAATVALAAASSGEAHASGPIDPSRLSAIVEALASDAYQGRAPGTPGEDKTIAYLVRQVKALGLEPAGPNGSFIQPVPLVRTQIGTGTMQAAVGAGQPIPLAQGQQVYVSTVRPIDRVAIANAPMVFVGYGVTAPERQWDDFKGVDLKGKVAVFLVNDPDFSAETSEPVSGKFGGRRMTYYGRWTYKFEEAARQGAIAALIVHDTPGAGYGWATVTAPAGENYDIVRGPADRRPVMLQGWIEGEAAKALFARAGLDLATLRIAARKADFRPVPLPGAGFSADLAVKQERVESRNVMAKITGATRPDETIMYGAHWDAYGVGKPDATGRTVRAGAADDAIGVAGVLEVARVFKAAKKPDRTIVFALWTGEERGLLGSEAYATHPLYPLGKMVANLTMDVLQTAGPARDVVLVGDGQSDLEDRLATAARAQNRTITPEALPERGLYFRADHFSVARRGVPSLLLMGMSGGHDLVAGGRAAGDAWLTDYMKCYHQACDTWSPKWDLRGAAQDVDLLYTIGRDLAGSRDWPQWRPASEFRTLRDQSAADRN
ncbi:M28 family metallopeptidase [uncultured Sphingomonas sp.]|uniref:M28 family metallopeptidase n=1 Tax=uncultured Sphingomonas sp. TaxID=158754 RepID=UPI0025E8D900|nr:M28 family metallopeptidase [uncultured Sphingomonas sp.]